MKILLGVGRTLVDEHGTMQLQRSSDTWTIEVPDDGSEYLSRIWITADGMEVLSLPLTMGPAVTRFTVREEDQAMADRPLERPEAGDLKYDATLPKPGAFDEYLLAKYSAIVVAEIKQDGDLCSLLQDAFAAGWEAAILDHDC